MTILQDTATALPTGTWTLDPVHSRIEFAIAHNGISLFRGGFREIAGSLDASGLAGTAQVQSIALDDPDLHGHLLSPEFFDAERFPELSFRSRTIRVDGGEVEIDGEITIRGLTRPLSLAGTVEGPVQNPFGGTVLALRVEGALDRRDFGMAWNMELPGGGEYLGNEVELAAALELKQDA